MSNSIWQGVLNFRGLAITESKMLDVLKAAFIASAPGKPDVIVCGVTQMAGINAHVEFQGRNWRRIKREVNKAMRRARTDRRR